MKSSNRISIIALGLLLFSAPASANVIIPAIMGSWFMMFFALVPVIIIEAVVFSAGFGYSTYSAYRASLYTNFVSTIIGIPIASILLACFRSRAPHADLIDNFANRFDTRWKQIHAAIFIVPFGYEGDERRSADDWKAFRWVEPLSEFVIFTFFFLCSWIIEASIASRFDLLNESRLISGMLAGNAVSYSCVFIWFIVMHVQTMREQKVGYWEEPAAEPEDQQVSADVETSEAETS